MTSQSGGGGGYPGVTSDGAGGLAVQHKIVAGDPTATVDDDLHELYGSIYLSDETANSTNFDPVLIVDQHKDLPLGSGGEQALWVQRRGNISAQDYRLPAVLIQDTSGSAQYSLVVNTAHGTVLQVGPALAITGALSAVTDANAKDVLTSIIATLTGIRVTADTTT